MVYSWAIAFLYHCLFSWGSFTHFSKGLSLCANWSIQQCCVSAHLSSSRYLWSPPSPCSSLPHGCQPRTSLTIIVEVPSPLSFLDALFLVSCVFLLGSYLYLSETLSLGKEEGVREIFETLLKCLYFTHADCPLVWLGLKFLIENPISSEFWGYCASWVSGFFWDSDAILTLAGVVYFLFF